MADEFDPLKQNENKPVEELYATIQKSTVNNTVNEDDLLRSPFENILKLTNNQTNHPSEQQRPKEDNYHKLNFTNNAYKTPVRSTNPFNQEVQEFSQSISLSPPSSPIYANPPSPPIYVNPSSQATYATSSSQSTTASSKPPQTKTAVYEQPRKSDWKNSESYHDQTYEERVSPHSYPAPYYETYGLQKRRGLTGAMDRLVQRFPALGLLYRPSPPTKTYENYEVEHGQEYYEEEEEGGGGGEFYEESDEPPQLVDANSSSRELTANELALNERYSNKLRTQIINLQKKDETQPVDVRIHHESYTLYSCDVGRSVVEIFDMYGKLQHVIDDQTTIKFQPTAIAVSEDGTIIVASHFNQRLHMYLPDDDNQNENNQDAYHFKQYKLGSPGHDIHEFHFPAGIAIDFSDGYLYVCDRGNFRLQVMRPEGVCERVIDLLLNDGKDTTVTPIQIALQQNGDQMVCIIGEGDAICFLPKYVYEPAYVEPLYILDNDGLGLQGASGIAIDSNDRIFISDTGHHRIVICTPDGSYITHIGVEGNGPGELKCPCGLDITTDGTIVVADSGNKRLQLFGSVREQAIEENKSKQEKPDDKNILLFNPQASLS